MVNLTREDILNKLLKNRRTLKKYGVKKLGLFGSYVGGMPSKKSDIDIVVEFEDSSFDNYMDLKFFLEEILGRKVDLVIEKAIKPRLRPHILKKVEYVLGL